MKTKLILFTLLFLVSCGKPIVDKTIDSTDQEITLLKAQVKGLTSSIEASNKEIAFLNVDIIRLEAEIAQGLIDSRQANDTLQVIIESIRLEILSLEREIIDLKDLTQCEKKCKIK